MENEKKWLTFLIETIKEIELKITEHGTYLILDVNDNVVKTNQNQIKCIVRQYAKEKFKQEFKEQFFKKAFDITLKKCTQVSMNEFEKFRLNPSEYSNGMIEKKEVPEGFF